MSTTNQNAGSTGGDNITGHKLQAGETPSTAETGEIPVVNSDNVTKYMGAQSAGGTSAVSYPQQMPAEPVYETEPEPEYTEYDEGDYYPEEHDEKPSTTGYKIAIAVLSAGLVLCGALAFRGWADDNNAVSKGMESSEEINGLNKSLDELNAEHEELIVERDGLNFRIDDLNKQIDKLNQEKDSLSHDLDEANKQKDEAQKRADDAREEVGRLRSELDSRTRSEDTGRSTSRPSGISVPSVTGMSVDDAVSVLGEAGFRSIQINGDGDRVASQTPSAGSNASRSASVTITAE